MSEGKEEDTRAPSHIADNMSPMGDNFVPTEVNAEENPMSAINLDNVEKAIGITVNVDDISVKDWITMVLLSYYLACDRHPDLMEQNYAGRDVADIEDSKKTRREYIEEYKDNEELMHNAHDFSEAYLDEIYVKFLSKEVNHVVVLFSDIRILIQRNNENRIHLYTMRGTDNALENSPKVDSLLVYVIK